uniref:Uncharacterized protein n=1 Tax=Chromera velia CCMP2878 TaxID=1169474 RepID=A0A0G4FUA8_9ALVE|eukprot:Cvel_18815.t1-p1 / transcript=Cvel_18815.t1 / gene=Cvel_18815 / organism=Chromera_velia_CCMP2878 / gene_product=hypothetical protein / transcript_product=hypothetical protein / location=Cvel_scaffold1580:18452-19636(-) / protein_length=88 / sequence_SO=supercontig / SO=protein_coding / is_pseudo=false
MRISAHLKVPHLIELGAGEDREAEVVHGICSWTPGQANPVPFLWKGLASQHTNLAASASLPPCVTPDWSPEVRLEYLKLTQADLELKR